MAKMAPFPRRPSGFVRYGLVAIIILTALWMFRQTSDSFIRAGSSLQHTAIGSDKGASPSTDAPSSDRTTAQKPTGSTQKADASKTSPESASKPTPKKQDQTARPGTGKALPAVEPKGRHPIDKLIYDAQHSFAALTSGESKTLEEAAQAYRKRRGRHPPPYFNRWFEFAQAHNAMIVEDFFDQIYQDLEPFWGVDPAPMRREASQFEMTINVRDGVAKAGSEWPWTQIWLNMTKTVEHLLPDMDIALNAMDEPRLVVPWEDINRYVKNASKTVKLAKAKKMKNEFRPWPKPGTGVLSGQVAVQEWETDGTFRCDPPLQILGAFAVRL